MKEIFLNKKVNLICLVSSIIPIIIFLTHFGIDGDFFYPRLLSLADSIKNLDFYPDLSYNLYKNMDYISPTFYSLGIYYPFVLIYNLTNNMTLAFLLIVIFLQIVTTYSSYFIFNKLSKSESKNNVYFLMILYLNNPYRTALIVSSRYPELIALIPMMFGLYYFLKILNNRHKNKDLILFTVVTSITIYIHLLSGFMLLFVYLGLLLVNIKKINKQTILNYGYCGILSLLLLSFYIYPIILNTIKSDFMVENIKLVNISYNLSVGNLIYLLYSSLLMIPSDQYLSIFLIILFIFSIKFKDKNNLTYIILFLLLAIPILAYLKILDYTLLNNLQFIKRFSGILSILISFKLLEIKNFKFLKIKNLLKIFSKIMVISIIIYTPVCFNIFTQLSNKLNYSQIEITKTVKFIDYKEIMKEELSSRFGWGGEYIIYSKYLNKENVKKDVNLLNNYMPRVETDLIISNDLTYTEQSGYNKYKVSIQNPEKLTTTIIIPKFNYYGYQVYVNGVKTKTTQSKYGTIQLNNIKDKEINISVKYEKPKSIYISYLVSAITMLGLGIYYKKIRDC